MNSTALQSVSVLLGGDKFPQCESASLRLEKFVRIGDNTKKEEIAEVVKKSSGKIPFVKPKDAITFSAKLAGRLIINQAGGVLENAGLCLHPHFNAPYIPGSAVKGCARHAAWQAWNDAEEGEAKIAAAREVAEIFGYPTGDKDGLDKYLKEKCGYGDKAQSGKVAFLAAVPETTAPLVVDLVNCHHAEYYSGKRPYAADDESPIPNFFPAVASGARFTFTLAPCGCEGQDLLARAKHWLVEAVTVNGVGAKTAAGYGWFEYDEAAEAEKERIRKEKEEKKAQEEKARREAEAKAAEVAAARERRASMSLLERWKESGAAAVCGKDGKTLAAFIASADDAGKDELVRALQSSDGVGAEVWEMIRTDKKRKNQAVVDAVFKWSKERKLGRMPQ